MSNAHHPPAAPSAAALRRYAVLAQVEALVLAGEPVSAAVRQVAGRVHADAADRPRRVSARTIQRWRAAYRDQGLAGLEPQSRKRTDTSQALPPALVAFLRTEKKTDPRASVPELLRRARARGIVPEDLAVDRTTVWRACRRMGLVTRARPSKREGDMRRWQLSRIRDNCHWTKRLRRVML